MTREVWDDMTEGMQEDPFVVTDYLETEYDEMEENDIFVMYEVFLGKQPKATDKQEIFEELLEKLYVLTEEQPKVFLEKMKLLQKKAL